MMSEEGMTWEQLKKLINKLGKTQLKKTVLLWDNGTSSSDIIEFNIADEHIEDEIGGRDISKNMPYFI